MKEYLVQQLELAPKDATDQMNDLADKGWQLVSGSVMVMNNRLRIIFERDKIVEKKAPPKKKSAGEKVDVEIVAPEEE
jgi:hypothetical protein